jgi:hypothetical protein
MQLRLYGDIYTIALAPVTLRPENGEPVPTSSAVLGYARSLADELTKDMRWEASPNGGYWEAPNRADIPRIMARATAALEFFRQYAGANSLWTDRAISIYENKGERQSTESGARAVGDLLRAWADQVDAGITEIVGARAWAEVGVVSTDMMSQARQLLEDRKAHPAPAIVLCGAALETALRTVVNARGLLLAERPSMSAYARLLRQAQLITVQDMKDIEQCAGLRNAAAHGEFDILSRERAGLMEQQTNILLRRLADLQNPGPEN